MRGYNNYALTMQPIFKRSDYMLLVQELSLKGNSESITDGTSGISSRETLKRAAIVKSKSLKTNVSFTYAQT